MTSLESMNDIEGSPCALCKKPIVTRDGYTSKQTDGGPVHYHTNCYWENKQQTKI